MTTRIDVRGLECPEPKQRTIEALQTGGREELLVLLDDPASVASISAMLNVMGRPFRVERRPDGWKFTISAFPPAP